MKLTFHRRGVKFFFVTVFATSFASIAVAASPRGLPSGCAASAMSDAYWAGWNAEEQAKIDADIERNRKADFTVKAGAGLPAGTIVEVEQLDHDFRFGAHIFNFDQLGDEKQNDAWCGRCNACSVQCGGFLVLDHQRCARFDISDARC